MCGNSAHTFARHLNVIGEPHRAVSILLGAVDERDEAANRRKRSGIRIAQRLPRASPRISDAIRDQTLCIGPSAVPECMGDGHSDTLPPRAYRTIDRGKRRQNENESYTCDCCGALRLARPGANAPSFANADEASRADGQNPAVEPSRYRRDRARSIIHNVDVSGPDQAELRSVLHRSDAAEPVSSQQVVSRVEFVSSIRIFRIRTLRFSGSRVQGAHALGESSLVI